MDSDDPNFNPANLPLLRPVELRHPDEGFQQALDRHARAILSSSLARRGGDLDATAADLKLSVAELRAELDRYDVGTGRS